MKDFEKWATETINNLVEDVKLLKESSLEFKLRKKLKIYEDLYEQHKLEESSNLRSEYLMIYKVLIDEIKEWLK